MTDCTESLKRFHLHLIVLLEPGAPPANFTAEPTSTSSITLRWHPPGTQQNGVITEYRIRYRMVGSKDSKADIKAAGSLRSYIVSGKGNILTFKVSDIKLVFN